METIRSFDYVNDLGYRKTIRVYPPKNNEYHFEIWERGHGELCGTGEATAEELNELLAHYGVTDRV